MNSKYFAWWYVLAGLIFVFGTIGYVFRVNINDALSCWAYAEQCHARRIEGLSEKECQARDDMVVYLIDEKICLVRQP